MKLLELLPELEEGGVERHVLALSAALGRRGHQVAVVSGGGRLESLLAPPAVHHRLAVHRKNPLTILGCANRLATIIRREGVELIHAHSRVPAWVGYLASRRTRIPLVVTVHFLSGNPARWLYLPYRRADRVICVSRSVQETMADRIGNNSVVIGNGLPPPPALWSAAGTANLRRLLFIGRLTKSKGLQEVIQALSSLGDSGEWRLDILGDGPLRGELETLVREKRLGDRVLFHGFRDDTDKWLLNCSCLLFPSHHEGMPLTLARAVQLGVPILATDIPAVRELTFRPEFLVPPGDRERWRESLADFIASGRVSGGFNPELVPTITEMAAATEAVYRQAKTGDN